MSKVHIVGGDDMIAAMFEERGWLIVAEPTLSGENLPDLLSFTGGADVFPLLYGEHKQPQTYCDPERDREEIALLRSFPLGMPCVGICRGGQFLNVMAGGKMRQHVEKHGRSHKAFDEESMHWITVTSTHHQMMIPAAHGEVLLSAKETTGELIDVEAVIYDELFNYLCFQPHPEYLKPTDPCVELFFTYLYDRLL